MGTSNERRAAIFLTLLVLTSASMLTQIQVGEASPHDLDVQLSSGAHIYVDYDSGYSLEDRSAISGSLTTYLPRMADEFWMIYRDAFVTMRIGSPDTADGAIDYDAQGNIVSYSGTVTVGTGVLVYVLLHEWTHVFQFWIPNYWSAIGTHAEAVAVAYARALILENLGWDRIQEYQEVSGDESRVRGQLTSSLDGLGYYLQSCTPKDEGGLGYHLWQGWAELWYHDRQAFKKFNTWVAAQPSQQYSKLRDAVRASLFETYSDYAYDGLSVDDWLNAFSFYNSLSDVPDGQRMVVWDSSSGSVGSYVDFRVAAYARNGMTASRIPMSSYDITFYDGQTRQFLQSVNQASTTTVTTGTITLGALYPRMRDVFRIDVVAHLVDGGDLPATAYLAAHDNERGDRRVFFLNRDGYIEGSGSSNVGAVDHGLIKWTNDGETVEATVTWSGGTYTYAIENIMGDPAVQMLQIAVPLYESTIQLSPLAQTVNLGSRAQLAVHLSPKVSTGTITISTSMNQVDWIPLASTTPDNGYASFNLPISDGGTHYVKATWSGDGVIDPSQSSVSRVDIPGTATTTSTTITSSSSEATSSASQTTSMTNTAPEETTTSASSIVEGTTSSEQPTIPASSPARCVIATAAYGSEMAPEVAYMRYVRDRLIGSTALGRALVGAFNAFYYSWSPRLAEWISANELLKVVFRILLLPLVGIVHAAALTFTTVGSMTRSAEAASVIAFLAAAVMALAIYVVLPVLGVMKHVIRASQIWRRTRY